MTDNTAIIGPVQGTGADLVLSTIPSLEQVRDFIRASKAENTLSVNLLRVGGRVTDLSPDASCCGRRDPLCGK
jgi:hypothetical protein